MTYDFFLKKIFFIYFIYLFCSALAFYFIPFVYFLIIFNFSILSLLNYS